MDATRRSHERGTRRQLPVKGERKNITELTAIARIKPGNYPKERLPDEYKQLIFEKRSWKNLLEHKLTPVFQKSFVMWTF